MKRIDFISFEEFQKLMKAEKRKEMKLVMLLAFGAGLRISEIVGLKKNISICCQADVEPKRIEVIGKTTKIYFCTKCQKQLSNKEMRRGKEWAIPPLTPDKIDLQTHQIRIDMAKSGKWRVTVTPPSLTQELVNLLPIKTPRITIQYRFVKLAKKVLNKKLSFHILRHGFGNYQANVAKLPLPMVQQLMGHSRLDTTGIYTKANPIASIGEAWKGMGGK